VKLTDPQLRQHRAAAQLLHRPRRPAIEVVRHLGAVQAQDVRAAPLALRARSRGLTLAAVTAAREDRSMVRAWGPRGTLHLMAAEDVGWLVGLFGPQWIQGSRRRLGQEGVPGSTEELLRVTERALAGQGPLTKVQLGERLTALGCPAQGQGVVHLAALAAAHGLVVLGPDAGTKPTYVYAEDWLGRRPVPEPDRDRALAELARRYLRAHGPAGPEDLAAWSGLGTGEARRAFAAVADELVGHQYRDRPLWSLGGARAAQASVVLVPAFDEYLLGWRDRSLILDPAYTKTIVPGGGIVHPAVVADGRVVGTWRAERTELFEDVDEAAVRAELADITYFGGVGVSG
jgi:hypothetical protein